MLHIVHEIMCSLLSFEFWSKDFFFFPRFNKTIQVAFFCGDRFSRIWKLRPLFLRIVQFSSCGDIFVCTVSRSISQQDTTDPIRMKICGLYTAGDKTSLNVVIALFRQGVVNRIRDDNNVSRVKRPSKERETLGARLILRLGLGLTQTRT